MREQEILQLQRDALEVIEAMLEPTRLGSASPLKSIGDFDQRDAEVRQLKADANMNAALARWQSQESVLFGAAIGILIKAIDDLVGQEVTNSALAAFKEELAKKQSPFEDG